MASNVFPMTSLMALLLGFLLLFLHGSALLLLGLTSLFTHLEYCHIDINDNIGQQSPPLLLMAILFFSPPLTSMEKECSRTSPITLLLFFMNGRFSWVCDSPCHSALLLFTQDRRIDILLSICTLFPFHVSELLYHGFNNV